MSESNESRNCCYNNNELMELNNNIRMGDNTMQDSCCCIHPSCEKQADMLKEIKCYAFAIQELALYLDTHPNDEKALCLHNKYCHKYRELTDDYQKMFGPLTINCPCNKWRWIEEPWPWEGGRK